MIRSLKPHITDFLIISGILFAGWLLVSIPQ
jgi:hypothetical protein